MKPEKCPCCDGWGKRHVYHDGSTVGEIVTCPACNGTGVIWPPEPCRDTTAGLLDDRESRV
jgi:DnaJ-class molecular chaperone